MSINQDYVGLIQKFNAIQVRRLDSQSDPQIAVLRDEENAMFKALEGVSQQDWQDYLAGSGNVGAVMSSLEAVHLGMWNDSNLPNLGNALAQTVAQDPTRLQEVIPSAQARDNTVFNRGGSELWEELPFIAMEQATASGQADRLQSQLLDLARQDPFHAYGRLAEKDGADPTSIPPWQQSIRDSLTESDYTHFAQNVGPNDLANLSHIIGLPPNMRNVDAVARLYEAAIKAHPEEYLGTKDINKNIVISALVRKLPTQDLTAFNERMKEWPKIAQNALAVQREAAATGPIDLSPTGLTWAFKSNGTATLDLTKAS